MANAAWSLSQDDRLKVIVLQTVIEWARKKWPDIGRFYLADGPPVVDDRKPIPLGAFRLPDVALENFDDHRANAPDGAVIGIHSIKPSSGKNFFATVWLLDHGARRDNSGAGEVRVVLQGNDFKVAPFHGLTTTLDHFLLSEVAHLRFRSDILRDCQSWLWAGDRFWSASGSLGVITVHRGRLKGGVISELWSRDIPSRGAIEGSVRFSTKGTYLSWTVNRNGDETCMTARVENLSTTKPTVLPPELQPIEFLWVSDTQIAQVNRADDGKMGIMRFDAASGQRVSFHEVDLRGFGLSAIIFPRGVNHRGEIIFTTGYSLLAVSKGGESRRIALDASVPQQTTMVNMLADGKEMLCRDSSTPQLPHFRRDRFWRTTAEGKLLGKVTIVSTPQHRRSDNSYNSIPYTGFGTPLHKPSFVYRSCLWELR